MSYLFYKVLHIFGVLLVWTALAGLVLHAVNGGTKKTHRARAMVGIAHGVGMLIVLVGGFGLLARMGIHDFPAWVTAKLVLWFVVGGLIMVPLRVPALARPLFFVLPILGGLGAYLAIAKPTLPEPEQPEVAAVEAPADEVAAAPADEVAVEDGEEGEELAEAARTEDEVGEEVVDADE